MSPVSPIAPGARVDLCRRKKTAAGVFIGNENIGIREPVTAEATDWTNRLARARGGACGCDASDTPRVASKMRAALVLTTRCTRVKPPNHSRHRCKKTRHREPHSHAVPDAGSVWETAQFVAGTAAGVALVLFAWPAVKRELRPIRCVTCLGMSWTICDSCAGRGKTGLNLISLGDAKNGTLSYCKECAGKGRCPCVACNATGIENNKLYRPTKNPGWGPRGEWRDTAKPPKKRK